MHSTTVVKRSLVRLVLGGVAFVLLTGVVTFERQNLPLHYGLGPSEGQFGIEVTAVDYESVPNAVPFAGLNTNIEIPPPHPERKYTSERDLMSYLASVRASDYRRAAAFHAPGEDGAAALSAAEALGARTGDLKQVDFLKKLFYGRFRIVFLRLIGDDGRSLVAPFYFIRTAEGFRQTVNLAPDHNDLRGLFESLAWQMEQELAEDDGAGQFDHALDFGTAPFGLQLKFDGELFSSSVPWLEPAAVGPATAANDAAGDTAVDTAEVTARITPRAFVETVLFGSAALEDEAFAALWCGEDRRRFAGRTPLLADAKRAHTARRAVKHVATMTFRDRYAHFYLDQDDPERVKVAFLAAGGDGYCLSQGPRIRGLRDFLGSATLGQNLLDLWRRKG